MPRNFTCVRTHVNFTRVNKLEAMYEVSRVNVKVERRSTFTFTRGLSYIACTSFTLVKFTCVRTQKLRDSGNQPRGLLNERGKFRISSMVQTTLVCANGVELNLLMGTAYINFFFVSLLNEEAPQFV